MNKLINWFKTKKQLSNETIDWKVKYRILQNMIKSSDSIYDLREALLSNRDLDFKIERDLSITTGHWLVKVFALSFRDYLIAEGAKNYVSIDILPTIIKEKDGKEVRVPHFTVTIQKHHGETPTQQLIRFKARIRELEEQQCLETKDMHT